MKILQIAHHSGVNPTSGGEHRIHGLMQASSQKNKITRWVFQHNKSDKSKQVVEQIDKNHNEIQYQSTLRWTIHGRVHRVGARTPLDSDRVGQWLLLNEYRLLRHLSEKSDLEERIQNADVIQVEYPWLFPFFHQYTPAEIPVVYSSHNDELEYHQHLANSHFNRYLLWLMKRRERYAVEKSDAVVAVSKRDILSYRDRGWDVGRYTVASNGAPNIPATLSGRSAIRPTSVPKHKPLCIFVGSNANPSNIEAADCILSAATELLDTEVQIALIGTVCDEYENPPKNVHLVGFVDKLKPYLFGGDIALNPVAAGSGSNIKLAEYLAHGLPVISTRFGARGYDVKPGTHYIETTIESFPETIETVAKDQERQSQIGTQGRMFAVDNLNWETISHSLFHYYRTKLI